jgi:hypothetical protein
LGTPHTSNSGTQSLTPIFPIPNAGYTFDAYTKEFNKLYASAAEREFRRGTFEARLAKIRAHNADPTKTWKEGVNHLTDRTESEFRSLLGYKPAGPGAQRFSAAPLPAAIRDFDPANLPDRVDWREKGVVSPVKDQGGWPARIPYIPYS